MILSFSVDNYLSFGSHQELSFEATADSTGEESFVVPVVHPKSGTVTRLLRMSVIYGANASGKSNLLHAIKDIWLKLYTPLSSKDEKVAYRPFAMRKDEPTKMQVSFFIDGVRYDYELMYDGEAILHELLEFNPNGVTSLFYERTHNPNTNIPEISFGKNTGLDAKTSSALSTNTLPNHSVLSTYNKISVDAPAFKRVVEYIRRSVLPERSPVAVDQLLKDALAQKPRRSFLLRAVKEADFNITDMRVRSVGKTGFRIEVEHDCQGGDYVLPLESESAGTLAFIQKIDVLYDVLKAGRVLMIDELDESMHHDLLVFFLQTFLNNQGQAQLLFTLHDQLLLAEDIMRRDMVWFTEKQPATASTDLFSANDFNLHKNASILNAYKMGKLGAKPHVGSPFIKIERQP